MNRGSATGLLGGFSTKLFLKMLKVSISIKMIAVGSASLQAIAFSAALLAPKMVYGLTCREACQMDGLQPKAEVADGESKSPPCFCLKPKDAAANDQQAQQPPPPPPPSGPPPDNSKNKPPKGGDDQCSQEGAGSDSKGRSCADLKDHVNNVASSSSSEDMDDPAGFSSAYMLSGGGVSTTAMSDSAAQRSPVFQAGQTMNQMKGQQIKSGVSRARNACDKEMQCRDKKIQELQARVAQGDQSAQSELQKEKQKKQKAQQDKQEAESQEGKGDQAMAQAMQMMQAMMGAIAAMKGTGKAAGQQYDLVAPSGNGDCSNARYAATDIACLCDVTKNPMANPRDPQCAKQGGQTAVISPTELGKGGLPFTPEDDLDPGGRIEGGPVFGTAAKGNADGLGAGGGGGGGAGGSGVQSFGQDQAPGGPQKEVDKSVITGQSGAGAMAGGGGGSYGGGSGSGGGGGLFNRFSLKKFLPNKDFRSRNMSGMSVPAVDGMTGPNGPTIWQKNTRAYQIEDSKGRWLRGPMVGPAPARMPTNAKPGG